MSSERLPSDVWLFPEMETWLQGTLLPALRATEGAPTTMTTTHVVILRGLPGSGKTLLGWALRGRCLGEGITGDVVCCSANDHFELPNGGGYRYDRRRIHRAHELCRMRFAAALTAHARLVLVDNTNSQRWEYQDYVGDATRNSHHDVRVHILELVCPSEELAVRMCLRNVHGVDLETVLRMFRRWEHDDAAIRVTPQFPT